MTIRRIGVIFRKELADILRDRRTLIAMVVVPVLLYPVLMLGSLHAAQFQSGKMQKGLVRIGVADEALGRRLEQEIRNDALQGDVSSAPASGPAPDDSLDNREILVYADPVEALRAGAVHVAVVARAGRDSWDRWEIDPPFVILYDSAEIRSEMARTRLERVLERRRNAIRTQRLEALPAAHRELYTPRMIPVENVATPEKVGGSLLGNVLPLILALMTITAAVYPAIDLTAGERERGTLETLMVAPVPVIDVIAGKFLVVATVSIIAALLNLASIGLTLRFGDVQEMLAQGMQATIPVAVLPLILVAMIPFTILFSAILVLVASFARSFKEAQNYVMPVIMAALIPGTAGALPGVELKGVMTLIPVANMVLLTRELLLSHFANWPAMLLALGSTCFYAVVAVVAAAKLFGQEAVLFADAGSWKTLFRRRLFVPRPTPSSAHVLLYVAVLFPVWFHIQGQLHTQIGLSAALIVVFFGIAPIALATYLKIDLRGAFSFRGATAGRWIGALAIGLGSWAVAYELLVLQARVLPVPADIAKAEDALSAELAGRRLSMLLLALAVVPGVCEELTFRGLVLSGLRSGMRAGWAILVTAILFACFHFLLFRFPVTCALGLMLGVVCRRAGSVFPAMLIHVMHNGWLIALNPREGVPDWWAEVTRRLGTSHMDGNTHLPPPVIGAAVVLVAAGLLLICRRSQRAVAEAAGDALPSPPPAPPPPTAASALDSPAPDRYDAGGRA